MEAPKKIYIHPDIGGREFLRPWLHRPANNESVEYTQTDAFIEKALAYLNSKFYFHNAFYGVVSTDFSAMEELFEDFKNYMKGE